MQQCLFPVLPPAPEVLRQPDRHDSSLVRMRSAAEVDLTAAAGREADVDGCYAGTAVTPSQRPTPRRHPDVLLHSIIVISMIIIILRSQTENSNFMKFIYFSQKCMNFYKY